MTTLNLQITVDNDDAIHNIATCTTAAAFIGGWLSNVDYMAAARFSPVTVPPGAIISACLFGVHGTTVSGSTPHFIEIICEADDDPPDFVIPCNLVSRPRTTAFVRKQWTPPTWVNTAFNNYEIPAILQELVDRTNFAQDHVNVFMHGDPDNQVDTSVVIGKSFNVQPVNAPKLTIVFSTPGPPPEPATASAEVDAVPVGAVSGIDTLPPGGHGSESGLLPDGAASVIGVPPSGAGAIDTVPPPGSGRTDTA